MQLHTDLIAITSVNKGKNNKPNDECISLMVRQKDLDLTQFILVDRTFDGEGLSNISRHLYHFPEIKHLKEGDSIHVFTGVGKDISEVIGNQSLHRLYMQSKRCIWNNREDEQCSILKVELHGQNP